MTTEPILKTVTLNATPETVYDALTQPAQLTQWFAKSADIDPTDGSDWKYDFGGGLAAEGRVIEAARPSLFVWSWEKSITGDEVTPSDTVSTYRLEPTPDGGTLLHMKEENHPTQEMRDGSEQGLVDMIETLRAFVEDGKTIDWSEEPAEG